MTIIWEGYECDHKISLNRKKIDNRPTKYSISPDIINERTMMVAAKIEKKKIINIQ